MTSQLRFDFEQPLYSLTPEDIYQHATERTLRALKEDRRIERKSARYSLRDLGDYFSMFANTAGGGIILFGVENNGEWSGCRSVGEEKANKAETAGRTYCADAVYSVKRVVFLNNGVEDFILVFYVRYHQSRAVRTSETRVFVRIGDECIELLGDAIRGLEADKGQIHFEQEPCGLRFPEDFDTSAIEAYLASVRSVKPEYLSVSTEKALTLRTLGRMDGDKFIPNYACALLFAKNPGAVIPGCRVQFYRFDGKEQASGKRFNATREEHIEGTIPQILARTEQVLDSQLRSFSVLNSQEKFAIVPEYPKDVWYEAIVNALVHRAYSNGQGTTPVFVRMFDNQLVIDSPGGFMPYVTPSNIYGNHRPRNPFLMNALYYLSDVKQMGEGTIRMRELMRDSGFPDPVFEQKQDARARVEVSLSNNIANRRVWADADVADLIGATIANSLDAHQKRIVNYIAENGAISVSDAQRLTGLSWPAARKKLGKLVDLRILEHHHKDGKERDPKAHFTLAYSGK